MAIPVLINTMLDDNNYRTENILIALSEQTPLLLYPYFSYIVRLLDKYDNFVSWNVWQIIANLLIVDYLEMWEDVKDRYFNAFKSENIAEILVLISTAKKVVKFKSNDKDTVFSLLEDCKNNNFKICGETAPHLNAVAKQAIDEFFNNL